MAMEFNNEAMRNFLRQYDGKHIARIPQNLKTTSLIFGTETHKRLSDYCKERGLKKQNIIDTSINFYLDYLEFVEKQ